MTTKKRSHKNTPRLTARERALNVCESVEGPGVRHDLVEAVKRALQAHAREALARHKAKVLRGGTVVMMPGTHRYMPGQGKRKAGK